MRMSLRTLCCPTAFVIAMAACGGGGDTGTTPNPTPQGFSVSLSATSLSVAQGASGSVIATIGRTGSFSGTVNLSTEGVPAGISASFNPAAISSSTTSTTLTVTAGASVATGTHTFTVRGQASGLSDQTSIVTVTVTARPAIAMVLAPTAASVAQGAAVNFTATITRTNFTGAVAVAVTGATGITTAVTAAGDVHTVGVNVASTVAPGTYTLTATATGSAVTAVSANFTLTVTAAPAASISLTATPPAITVQAGGTAVATTVGITRTNFTGTVVVAVQSGLPSGVTTSNNPAGPTAANSVVVTFTAAANAAPGTHNVVLQGAGNQATPGTVTIALTVTPANSGGSIALSATPATLAIQLGGQANATITIARTNFSGTVNLAVTGAVTGLTTNLNTASTAGTTATLSVAVGAGAALGTYPITVTASGTGVANAQVVVNVTVMPVSSGGNVTWRFCAATGIPVWLAVQDGSSTAPWTQVAAGAGNTYSFNLGSRGAVATVFQNAANQYTLNVTYGTLAELQSQGTATCGATPPVGKTVTGTVTGFLSATDIVLVSMGAAFASPPPSQAFPNFQLAGVLDGNRDLVGTRSALNIANPTNPITLNRIFIKRGLNPPNLSSVGTVDFNGADAFDPELRAFTIDNIAGGEQVSVSNIFLTSNLTFGSLGSVSIATGNSVNLFVVPSARTVAGDVQAIAASAATISGSLATQIRSMTVVYRDPATQSIPLGATVNTPTISVVATAPYARLRTQLSRQADYNDNWSTNYTQAQGAMRRSSTISMSSGYLGGGTTFDVALPDFTGVGGWQDVWGLVVGTQVFWNVTSSGWVSSTGGLVEGSVFRTGQRNGTVTP